MNFETTNSMKYYTRLSIILIIWLLVGIGYLAAQTNTNDITISEPIWLGYEVELTNDTLKASYLNVSPFSNIATQEIKTPYDLKGHSVVSNLSGTVLCGTDLSKQTKWNSNERNEFYCTYIFPPKQKDLDLIVDGDNLNNTQRIYFQMYLDLIYSKQKASTKKTID